MSNIWKKIKTWYTLRQVARQTYERKGIRPVYQWHVVLGWTFIILLIGAGAAFYLYTEITQNKIFLAEASDDLDEIKIDQNLLQKTISDIDKRAATTTAIKQNKINIPDPSM